MQQLENRTFSKEMQRPSVEKLWQMPAIVVLPRLPAVRCDPLDVQAASYFAASVSTASFSISVMENPSK